LESARPFSRFERKGKWATQVGVFASAGGASPSRSACRSPGWAMGAQGPPRRPRPTIRPGPVRPGSRRSRDGRPASASGLALASIPTAKPSRNFTSGARCA